MFHKSELGPFGEQFPHDAAGGVPVPGDSWRQMRFDHDEMDPDEQGISAEERARRIEYLDTVWWPKLLEKVNAEKLRLQHEHGESFIARWERVVNRAPEPPHGTEVG